MGSFNVDGQRYSLMTMDALKASRCDGGRRRKNRPMTNDTSTVYLDNLLHVIQPVRHNETEMLADAGKLGTVNFVGTREPRPSSVYLSMSFTQWRKSG